MADSVYADKERTSGNNQAQASNNNSTITRERRSVPGKPGSVAERQVPGPGSTGW